MLFATAPMCVGLDPPPPWVSVRRLELPLSGDAGTMWWTRLAGTLERATRLDPVTHARSAQPSYRVRTAGSRLKVQARL